MKSTSSFPSSIDSKWSLTFSNIASVSETLLITSDLGILWYLYPNYYDSKLCTKEVMQELMSYIDRFLSNITENKHKALLERRETEEEAREYFGDEFIKQFN